MGAPSLILSGVGLAASLFTSRKARKQDKKARDIDNRRNRLQSSRQAINQVKEAQKARAQIIAQGEAQGVGGSSAVAGGAGAVQSTAGANIGFAQQIFNLQQSSNRLRTSAQSNIGKAQAFGAVTGFAANADFSPGKRADGGAPVIDITN